MMSTSDCLQPIDWESRNLGLQSFAVKDEFLKNFDETLLKSALAQQIKTFKNIFVQTRINKDAIAVGLKLSQANFYFVESTVCPHIKLNKSSILHDFLKNKREYIPHRYELTALQVDSIQVKDHRIEDVKRIAAQSFTDDRFHVDPNCPQDIADRRFTYWIDDLLLLEDIRVYICSHKSESVGFFIRCRERLILAGFTKQYVTSGLGDFLWLCVLEDMLNEGFDKARTLVSTNNIASLNLHARLGFKFKDPLFTFHHWSNLRKSI